MATKPSKRHSYVVQPTIRLLIALQVVLVIVIFASVIFQTNYAKNSILNNNLDHAVSQSVNVETMLTLRLNLLRMHLLNMDLDDVFDENSLNQYRDKARVKLNNALNKLHYIRSLSIVDINNYIVYSTTPENVGLALDTSEYIPVAANNIVGALRFSKPLLGRDFYSHDLISNVTQDNKFSTDSDATKDSGFFPVAMLLPDHNEWTVVATINSDYFINHGESINSIKELVFKAYLDTGDLIFSNDIKDYTNSVYEDFDKYNSKEKSSFKSLDNENLTVYRSSSAYPFFVQTQLSKKDALQDWQKTTRKLQISAVIIVILLLVITAFLTKRVHKLLVNQARLNKENEEAINIWREQELKIRKLLQAVEQSPTSIVVTDLSGSIEYANTEFYKSTGYSPKEVIGTNPRILASGQTPPDRYEQLWQSLTSGKLWEGELINRRKNGSIYIERALLSPLIDLDGKISNYVGVKYDITEEKKQEEELKLAASVMANTLDGVFICDKDKRIIDINPAFTKITGYSREDVLGKNPKVLSSGRYNNDFYQQMWTSIDGVGYWQGEIWNHRKDGSLYIALSNVSIVRDNEGEIRHYINVFSDITQLKKHQENLELLAHYDPLTQLPNRVLLQDRLQIEMSKSKRENNILAVCFMDLDGFKVVNDTYGHKAGDELLKVIARRLEENIRSGDTAARIGGDEFVMLLSGIESVEQYENAAMRILKAIEKPVLLSGSYAYVTGSMGITIYPYDNSEAEQLMRHADHAMYQAKQAGRNRYVVYDPLTDTLAQQNLRYISEINSAIKYNQFQMLYQPKLNLKFKEIAGFEALIRWNHPVRGVLLPEQFMPRVIENNLEHKVDLWVIENVFNQIDAWQSEGMKEQSVSINIGANSINQPDFVKDIEKILNSHPNIKARQIEFEVLESSAINSLSNAQETLSSLRGLDFKIALDDFGTGYSSLSLLRHLPINTLKIDKSFVSNMLSNRNDLSIVESVIRLAMAFKHEVIAEGVETVSHAQALSGLGCYIIQGYCVSPPLQAQQIKSWLAAYDIDKIFKTVVDISVNDIKSTIYAVTLQHSIWIGKLEDLMAGNINNFDALLDLDPNKCAFSAWQQWAETQPNISRNPKFEPLKNLHLELHQTGFDMIKAVKLGNKEESKKIMKLLYQRQSDFLTKLENIQS